MIRTSGMGLSLPFTAALVALALVAFGACTVAPDAGDGVAATSLPTPTDEQPTGSDEQPTQPPAAPTADPAPTEPAPTEPPDGPSTEVSVAGAWTGTIVSGGNSQGIRFTLRDIGGVISGTALWDNGKVDNGLRGALVGDLVKLDDSLVNGINVYEGAVNGDVFSGTWTTVPRLEGQSPSTFEVTREE